MLWNDLDQQACSVSRTLSVIGDRWTLLILRDCFLKIRRFDDFQAKLGIGRRILSDRLQKLVDNGVLARVEYQDNPVRHEYRLTQRGLDLYPVIMAIVHWGDIHMSDRKGRPLLHEHQPCGHQFDPLMVCSHCRTALDPKQVKVLPGRGAAKTQAAPRRKAG